MEAGAKRSRGLSRGPLAKGFRVKAGRRDGQGPPCGDACGVERACHGHLANARQYAVLILIHLHQRMRRQPAPTTTKGWSRFIISRRNGTSTGEWDPGHFPDTAPRSIADLLPVPPDRLSSQRLLDLFVSRQLEARERQVEKYNGFGPIWPSNRKIFQPVAREMAVDAC